MPELVPNHALSRRSFLAAAGAVSLGAALAACSGGGGTAAPAAERVSQADIDKAMSTPPN